MIGRRRAAEPVTECPQCGRDGADVLRRTARRVRRSCRACGAVTVTAASWTGRPRIAAGAPADPLAAYMPAAMARWLRERPGGADLPAAPGRTDLVEWYSRFDDLLVRARTSPEIRARYEELAGDGDPLRDLRPAAKAPKFTKVIGAVNAACFDAGAAAARLLPPGAGEAERAVTVERARGALAWLAGPGAAHAWISGSAPEPARADVEGLLAAPDLALAVRGPGSGVLCAALFGVAKGPNAGGVIALFTEPTVRAALRAYLDAGERPLLEELRERLKTES
ncbi:hypothetical protein [Actinomadura parmotrematis]|uniref:Uncharacterized protein n=1 Tax=Actinomadura parmotrematis TaxID=2864039 RepID=A0ABS7FLD4_9ACTN|nr:hypothetical protein [Actinomadura parmotrematis]MBW8481171.1 hypothetical protein [Actinomadura parmotrematis]